MLGAGTDRLTVAGWPTRMSRPLAVKGGGACPSMFLVPVRQLGQVLVPVRQLGQGARMKGDRLREVELDRVAPGRQQLFNDTQDELLLDQSCGLRRPNKQPAKPFGALAVETTAAKGSRFEIIGEVTVELGNRLPRDEVGDDAVTLRQKLFRPAVDFRYEVRRRHGSSPFELLSRCLEHRRVLQALRRVDAVGCEKGWGVRTDVDTQRAQHPSVD